MATNIMHTCIKYMYTGKDAMMYLKKKPVVTDRHIATV